MSLLCHLHSPFQFNTSILSGSEKADQVTVMREMARTAVDLQARARLRHLGVQLLTEHFMLEWHGDAATVQASGGIAEVITTDALVLASTNAPLRELADDLNAPTVGDATAARTALMAVYEGPKLAMNK